MGVVYEVYSYLRRDGVRVRSCASGAPSVGVAGPAESIPERKGQSLLTSWKYHPPVRSYTAAKLCTGIFVLSSFQRRSFPFPFPFPFATSLSSRQRFLPSATLSFWPSQPATDRVDAQSSERATSASRSAAHRACGQRRARCAQAGLSARP